MRLNSSSLLNPAIVKRLSFSTQERLNKERAELSKPTGIFVATSRDVNPKVELKPLSLERSGFMSAFNRKITELMGFLNNTHRIKKEAQVELNKLIKEQNIRELTGLQAEIATANFSENPLAQSFRRESAAMNTMAMETGNTHSSPLSHRMKGFAALSDEQLKMLPQMRKEEDEQHIVDLQERINTAQADFSREAQHALSSKFSRRIDGTPYRQLENI